MHPKLGMLDMLRAFNDRILQAAMFAVPSIPASADDHLHWYFTKEVQLQKNAGRMCTDLQDACMKLKMHMVHKIPRN